MPTAPKAQAKADVDPVLQTQVTTIKQQAQAEQQAIMNGNQSKWMMPTAAPGSGSGWKGSIFDVQGMEAMFDRSKSNQAFADSIKDPTNPGTVGDSAVTTTQIDLLASMERAWRNRHTMRRPRSMCHAMGRKAGHGNDKGPLVQSQLEHVRGMVRKSKGSGPS
jgi:hypothetical protein